MALLLATTAPGQPLPRPQEAVRPAPPGTTPLPARAGAPTATPAPLPADHRTPVQLRLPPAGRLQAYRKQRAFRYVEPVREPDSTWSLFWWRVGRWLLGLFDGPGYNRWGRYVVYAAFGLAFLYVVLRLLRLDLTALLRRRPAALPLAYETMPEDIHADDLPPRLAAAETAGDYRLAVRLGYLLTLRALAERELIRWQPEKTNQAYLRELQGTRWRADFGLLTRQFEYAWYGEQPLTAADYARVLTTRQQFEQQLTSTLSVRP